jgi:large subunit ribosomal protein L23
MNKSEFNIIVHPLITEKGSAMATDNKYQFVVAVDANKIEIRNAIETIYNVKVKSVNTLKIQTKMKRVRQRIGRTPQRKKAIVTLEKNHIIELV